MNEAYIVYSRRKYINNKSYFELNMPNKNNHYVFNIKNLRKEKFDDAGLIIININAKDYRDAISQLTVLNNISGNNCNIIIVSIKTDISFTLDQVRFYLKKLDVNYLYKFGTPQIFMNLISVTNIIDNYVASKNKSSNNLGIYIVIGILLIVILGYIYLTYFG